MADWRMMMKDSYSPTQYPQNPQKRVHRSHSEDCEDSEDRHTESETVIDLTDPPGLVSVQGYHEWWTAQWKDLAMVTDQLLPDDPRVAPVLDCLATCDHFYALQDLNAFVKASQRVQRLMAFAPGARVWWEGEFRSHRLGVLGPAKVEQVICSEGRLWTWVFWGGTGRWVCESIVSRIEGPTA